jgi:hypothetical protein
MRLPVSRKMKNAGMKNCATILARLPAESYLEEPLPLMRLLMLTPIFQENVLKAKLMLRVYPAARFR